MTWPQYRRGQCSIDGWTIDLSPMETELLLVMLLRYPGPVPIHDLIDALYPDPDKEPGHPEVLVVQRMRHLARKIGTYRIDYAGRTIGYRLHQSPSDAQLAA